MRVVPALAFALSIAALVGCDRVGRSVVGAPESLVPRDDGFVDAVDTTTPIDVPTTPIDVPATPRDAADIFAVCDVDAGQQSVNGACITTGELSFTLTWDHPGDVDLHVVMPGGGEIYYGDLMPGDGRLENDDTSGTGPENIFWAIPPSGGDYTVCVMAKQITMPTHFTVSVRVRGVEVMQTGGPPFTGTLNEASEGLCGDMSAYFVGTYTVTDPGIPDM